MTSLPQAVHAFADDIARKFAALATGQPEDQLRGPTERLLAAAGQAQGLGVVAEDESPIPDQAGRPDVTQRFTGHNRDQWCRFAHLPNLVYTDGNDWALYRSGERQRKGRKSSPLDDIVPDAWPAEYTTELLERILAGPLLPGSALGPVPDAARQAPAAAGTQTTLSLDVLHP